MLFLNCLYPIQREYFFHHLYYLWFDKCINKECYCIKLKVNTLYYIEININIVENVDVPRYL
jgi:hypothetical protein